MAQLQCKRKRNSRLFFSLEKPSDLPKCDSSSGYCVESHVTSVLQVSILSELSFLRLMNSSTHDWFHAPTFTFKLYFYAERIFSFAASGGSTILSGISLIPLSSARKAWWFLSACDVRWKRRDRPCKYWVSVLSSFGIFLLLLRFFKSYSSLFSNDFKFYLFVIRKPRLIDI